jgi:hypothetical protein
MKPEVFNDVVCKQFERCMETLGAKKTEYSGDKDRLDQFKRGGNFRGKHPMDVLAGMMMKHTTSVYDLIERQSNGETVGLGMWEEKITDHINYLVLLMGLVCDVGREE